MIRINKTIHSLLHAPDFAFPLPCALVVFFFFFLLSGSGRRDKGRRNKGKRRARTPHICAHIHIVIHTYTQNGISCNSEVVVLALGG